MRGPLPEQWETYQLLRLGLSYAEALDIPNDQARGLLEIQRAVNEAERKAAHA